MTPDTNPYQVSNASLPMFEPEDHSPSISPWRLIIWSLVYFYPLLAIALFYSSWIVAWMCLGHIPRPMIDDPKYIGGAMDYAYLFSALALLSAPILTPLGFVSSFFCPMRVIRDRRAQALFLASAYVAASVGIFLMLRLDPGSVAEWWID